jgi:hypothetical protein
MIRPFDWRDLGLLHRVRNDGLCTDAQLAYTRGPHALQTALLDTLLPGGSACTLVARPEEDHEPSVVGQFRHHNGEPHATLAFLGPTEAFQASGAARLLDGLAKAAGRRGAHHLLAEIDERNEVFELFRRAGFAVYARQRIWKLSAPLSKHDVSEDSAWRSLREEDLEAVLHLYANIVPALVKQVEPLPGSNGRGFVHWQDEELLGFLDVDYGPRGTWVQPYIHPAAERADDLLEGFLTHSTFRTSLPIYLCVRSYQAGLRENLERLGFEALSDQAVMVKRLAVSLREDTRQALPTLEGAQPKPTAPFAPMKELPSPYRET